MKSRRILVVANDDALCGVVRRELKDGGCEVRTALSAHEALAALTTAPKEAELVIAELGLRGMRDLEFVRRVRWRRPGLAVILIAEPDALNDAIEAMRLGASDYVTKPLDPALLRLTVARVLDRLTLVEEIRVIRHVLDQWPGFEGIVGHSTAIRYALDIAIRAAQCDEAVLIRGEKGTGKQLLARGIHSESARRNSHFLAIEGGASTEFLRAESFGDGGKPELPEGGTVYLDEVGDVPPDLQPKLLKLIDGYRVEAADSVHDTGIDVRVIAATSRDLPKMVANGHLLEELYARLSVFSIDLPPLRERMEDLPRLLVHLFAAARQKHHRPMLTFPAPLLPGFSSHHWPGNVDELASVIDHIVALAEDDVISAGDLPETLREPPEQGALPAEGFSLDSIEKEMLLRALKRANGDTNGAAELLHLNPIDLARRFDKFGIPAREAKVLRG